VNSDAGDNMYRVVTSQFAAKVGTLLH
jgi:hypothetical protein